MIRFLLFGAAMFIPPASADTTLVYHLHQADDSPLQKRLLVSDGKVAIYGDPNIDRPTLVYDRSQSALTFIKHSDRQFIVISEKWAKQASDRFKLAVKRMDEQLQKQLENMTPQQRSMYQQGRMMMPMMAPMMGGASTPLPARTYLPYGTESIGAISCRRVDVLENGQKVQQLCVTDAAGLKIPASDYQTFQAMLQVTERLANQGLFSYGFNTPIVTQSGGNTQGIPVIVKDLKTRSTVTLQQTRFEPIDADTLRPPKDYLEAKIPLPAM